MTTELREGLLLGGVTVAVAIMIAIPRDDVRYERCVRAEVHREAARVALEDGRVMRARREAQAFEGACPRLVPELREIELAAMAALRECSDARDLARSMGVEAPPCSEREPSELADEALAATRRGDAREARRLFEGALGVTPEFKAGAPLSLGAAARIDDVAVACSETGLVVVDLRTEAPTFVPVAPGYGCMLEPKTRLAWVRGHMIDLATMAERWSSDGKDVAFSSDGTSFLEQRESSLVLRDARSGEVRQTFAARAGYDLHATDRGFTWDDHETDLGTGRHLVTFELDVDPPVLRRVVYVEAEHALDDGRHRVVIDAARSAIVITNLATHHDVLVPVKTSHIWRMAFASDGKTLLTQSISSTRRYDLTTGELEPPKHEDPRRVVDSTFATASGSSILVGLAASQRKIDLDDVEPRSGEHAMSLLRASAPGIALPRDLEVKIDRGRIVLTRGVRDLAVRFFTRGRAFVESAGLFEVIGGDVPVKCFMYRDSRPLPDEACAPRRTPGLLADFLRAQ